MLVKIQIKRLNNGLNNFCFLYVCGVTRGYIDLDCALLLTNHMLNYITIHISGGHCDSDHD